MKYVLAPAPEVVVVLAVKKGSIRFAFVPVANSGEV
jgi:hypothetical protein